MLKLLDAATARMEAVALRAFPPAASVRCVDHADDLGALLLERLAPESLVGRPADEQIVVQAQLARALAVADPGGIPPLATGLADHLDRLRERAPDLLGRRALEMSADVASVLGRLPGATLTHGDLHAANVHRDADGIWRTLDPNPRVGTIAHESHTVVVERSRLAELIRDGGRLELVRRLDLFAEVAGVDAGLAAGACQMRAALSALHAADEGNAPIAEQLGWMAEALAE